MKLPRGAVTYLSAEIVESTLLRSRYAQEMQALVARYDALAAGILPQYNCISIETFADAGRLTAAASSAVDVVMAACALLQAFQAEPWRWETPPRVRMALHSGKEQAIGESERSPDLIHCDYLRAAAHGGQALLSEKTYEALANRLPDIIKVRDLGEFALLDLGCPEHLYQVLVPELPMNFPPPNSLDSYPNNLPLQATRFIGQVEEMRRIKESLATERLLTLIGAAGVGKTRLANQVAATLLEDSGDGVWLVEFSALSDQSSALLALASLLKIAEEPDTPLIETLIHTLEFKRMVLVFDNCEPVRKSCAQLIQTLIHRCPNLRILATNREGLGLPGERVALVSPLSVPNASERLIPDVLWQADSARLIHDRIQNIYPEFELTRENAAPVGRILAATCGIPLAIELAADRLRTLSLERIAQTLTETLDRHAHEGLQTLPRNQVVRAVLEWSFDLLDAMDQAMLCRLSVLAGAWTLAAAEAVVIGEGVESARISERLEALVDHGLLRCEEQEGVKRYRIPEVVRLYAGDFLEAQESRLARRNHCRYYLKMVQWVHTELAGPNQSRTITWLEREYPNLQTALAWSQEDWESADAGPPLAEALLQFWASRGYPAEGKKVCANAALWAEQGRTTQRADALKKAGDEAYRLGDFAVARARHELALSINQELGDRARQAINLHNLGNIAKEMADHGRAREMHRQALEINREMGDQAREAINLHNLGNAYKEMADFGEAKRYYVEALAIDRKAGNKMGIGHNLNGLARLAHAKGDQDEAVRLYEEALAIFRAAGSKAWEAYNLGEIVKLSTPPDLFWSRSEEMPPPQSTRR